MIVGTWNLENLFRPSSEDGPGDEQAYEAKLAELARVIGEIDPDVLAIQEVGDPEALEDLRERLDGDWHTETSEFPDARGIRVGFLSRLALTEVEQVREFPEHPGAGAGRRRGRNGGADGPRGTAGAGAGGRR